MKQQLFSDVSGWITLAALLAFSPQLSGCDSGSSSRAPVPAVPQAAETTPAPLTALDAKAATVSPQNDKATLQDQALEKGGEKAEAHSEALNAIPKNPPSPSSKGSAPEIKRLVIASAVEGREPLEITEATVGAPVVAFLEVVNPGDSGSDVIVTFEHTDGMKVGFIELSVPAESPRYRTWGRTRAIRREGEWTAVVSTKSGKELARRSFQVKG